MLRYLIALGGNALEEENMSIVAKALCRLRSENNEIVVTHGNGPQVGELYLKENKNLSLLTEETQKVIGNSIKRFIHKECRECMISVIMTRVLVNRDDREFSEPSKPIGRFYNEEKLVPRGKMGFSVKRMEKGYRLVVPSPEPLKILEVDKIIKTIKSGRIVIAAGGGGAPVAIKNRKHIRVNAVIDKDLTSALLAEKIAADAFFILTDVERAFINFGSADARPIFKMDVKRARNYMNRGYFGKGSMLPKVKACAEFAERRGMKAAIGNINNIEKVLSFRSCTIVTP